jgi:hypothetical protein
MYTSNLERGVEHCVDVDARVVRVVYSTLQITSKYMCPHTAGTYESLR